MIKTITKKLNKKTKKIFFKKPKNLMSHHIDSEEIQNTNSVFDDFYSEEED